MANKVSKQIKDAEVIEDTTKVTQEVEEQVSEETTDSQQEQKKAEPNKVNWKDKAKESIAKYRPVVVKTAKIVAGVTVVGLAALGLKGLIGESEEDQDDYDEFDDTQELINAEFTVVDSEE